MSFNSWKSYWAFSRTVRSKNRYIHNADVKEFLSSVLVTSKGRERKIEAGNILWRAQLGNDHRPVFHDGEEIADEPVPLGPDRMKPEQHTAQEGRANPKGIPYLYLATTKETAMSEVRPWIGSSISVGQLKVTRDLRVLDCSVNHGAGDVFYFGEPSDDEKEQAVWTYIDREFSKPVTISEKTSDYVPTQIIAELFKNEGFDGIVYGSALAKGRNVVLFDIDSAKIINCFLYKADKIDFSFSETANSYYLKESKEEKGDK